MDNPVRWSVRWLLITGGLGLAYVMMVLTLVVFDGPGGPGLDPRIHSLIVTSLAVCILLAGNAAASDAARDRATVHFNSRLDDLPSKADFEAIVAAQRSFEIALTEVLYQLQAMAEREPATPRVDPDVVEIGDRLGRRLGVEGVRR